MIRLFRGRSQVFRRTGIDALASDHSSELKLAVDFREVKVLRDDRGNNKLIGSDIGSELHSCTIAGWSRVRTDVTVKFKN